MTICRATITSPQRRQLLFPNDNYFSPVTAQLSQGHGRTLSQALIKKELAMARIMDGQVRHLFRLLEAQDSLAAAALKTGMDRKTARRYRDMAKLPSERDCVRDWRTRLDPFDGVWQEVAAYLEAEPALQAKTLFAWLQARYPGQFENGQLRTLQRRVQHWRATVGPAKEIFFAQVHLPGRLCASDFTSMNDLGVTIGGQPFDHLVYHCVLTYSNWESVTIYFSGSGSRPHVLCRSPSTP